MTSLKKQKVLPFCLYLELPLKGMILNSHNLSRRFNFKPTLTPTNTKRFTWIWSRYCNNVAWSVSQLILKTSNQSLLNGYCPKDNILNGANRFGKWKLPLPFANYENDRKQLWPDSELMAPLVNMIKNGCKNTSALFIFLIFHSKN